MEKVPKISVTAPEYNEHIHSIFSAKNGDYVDENNNSVTNQVSQSKQQGLPWRSNEPYDENNNEMPNKITPNGEAQTWRPLEKFQPTKQFQHQSPIPMASKPTASSSNGSKDTTATTSPTTTPTFVFPKRRNEVTCRIKFIRFLFVSSLICTCLFLIFYPMLTYYIEESGEDSTTESVQPLVIPEN